MMPTPAGVVWVVASGATASVTMPTSSADPLVSLVERLGLLGGVLLVGWLLIGRADRREETLAARLAQQLEAERTAGRERHTADRKRHDAEIAELRREIAELRDHARVLTDRLIDRKETS
jgi:hypothetical protein